MATLVPEPTYYTFGGPGGDDAPKGYQAVRAMYRDLFAMGGIANMRGEVADIVIDDRTIFFHSRLTSVVPWGRAKEAGYALSDERGHYAVHKRVAVVLPFDDKGLILGETAYVATDVHDFEPLGEDELSPGYIRWLKRFAPDT